MKGRTLTIRLQADWKAALRQAGAKAKARRYQGEELNFESPAAFFGRLTERRWESVRARQGQGPLPVRHLAPPGRPGAQREDEYERTSRQLCLVETAATGVAFPLAP